MSSLQNKEAAAAFLRMVVEGKVREAYERYVAPDFRHHNAYFAGDRESLLKGMEEAHRVQPNKIFEMKRVIGDGDIVAVHSHLRFQPSEPGMTVIHMLRFKDGRIAELWDLGQAIPADSPNKNGIF